MYAGEWALFRDWCTVTGRTALSAEPSDVNVEAFLVECPAAPATAARRLTAIAATHRAAGLGAPERNELVRDAAVAPPLGRGQGGSTRTGSPTHYGCCRRTFRPPGGSAGWTAPCWSLGAGLSYRAIARLTDADIEVRDGTASVSANGARVVVPGGDDPVSCHSCALVRWLRTLDFAVTRLNSTRSVAAALTRAAPLTSESKHLCRSTKPAINDTSRSAPLLPPIDQ